MISVLLIDSCEFVRIGVHTILNKTADIRLLSETAPGKTALATIAQRKPTVVLTEIAWREGDDRFRDAIREVSPHSRILFFSAFIDPRAIRATALGEASGYLLKDADADELIRAIRMVAEGRPYLDLHLSQYVLAALKDDVWGGRGPQPKDLSPQEQKIVACLAEGKTNKEIAVLLGLSDKTVKNYLSNAYEKLQLHRRSQAAAWYVKSCGKGLCPPDAPSGLAEASAVRCAFKEHPSPARDAER